MLFKECSQLQCSMETTCNVIQPKSDTARSKICMKMVRSKMRKKIVKKQQKSRNFPRKLQKKQQQTTKTTYRHRQTKHPTHAGNTLIKQTTTIWAIRFVSMRLFYSRNKATNRKYMKRVYLDRRKKKNKSKKNMIKTCKDLLLCKN